MQPGAAPAAFLASPDPLRLRCTVRFEECWLAPVPGIEARASKTPTWRDARAPRSARFSVRNGRSTWRQLFHEVFATAVWSGACASAPCAASRACSCGATGAVCAKMTRSVARTRPWTSLSSARCDASALSARYDAHAPLSPLCETAAGAQTRAGSGVRQLGACIHTKAALGRSVCSPQVKACFAGGQMSAASGRPRSVRAASAVCSPACGAYRPPRVHRAPQAPLRRSIATCGAGAQAQARRSATAA